jgi:hypothetical protein
MRPLAQFVSALSLAATIVPAVLFFFGRLDLDQVKAWMLAATVVWFVATPLWMDRKGER